MRPSKLLALTGGLILLAAQSIAAPVEQSLRPVARSIASPDGATPVVVTASASRPTTLGGVSLRPLARSGDLRTTPAPQPEPTQVATRNPGFERWLKGFRNRAAKAGIPNRLMDRAFRGITYNPTVVKKDRSQAEFTKTILEYVDGAASDTRITNGTKMLRKHSRTLNRIEARYGVDKEVVVAVWGVESNYGDTRGTYNVIEALATLAYDGRRGSFFEKQLIAALKILKNGDTKPANMMGSWAGAMGHTQFIPTTYQAYAVDFTGDGRRDIWARDPTDALASTAAYLNRMGWIKGQPWGVQVKLPKGFNRKLASRKIRKMPSAWATLGVKGVDGRAVRDYGAASLMIADRGRGVAFLIFKNFAVLERYNAADAYVVGVGHLSDRLKGKPALAGQWPPGDRGLTERERKELQKITSRAGFGPKKIDGKIGPNTIKSMRAYQKSRGMTPDRYPSYKVLQKMRR